MKNWIIALILGAAGYYIYKKGQSATAAAPGTAPAGFLSTMRSGLFATGSALLPGIVPAYTPPASYTAPATTAPTYTPTVTTGSSGGGDNNTGTSGDNSVITTEAPYFTRDLTRLTPFVNL